MISYNETKWDGRRFIGKKGWDTIERGTKSYTGQGEDRDIGDQGSILVKSSNSVWVWTDSSKSALEYNNFIVIVNPVKLFSTDIDIINRYRDNRLEKDVFFIRKQELK